MRCARTVFGDYAGTDSARFLANLPDTRLARSRTQSQSEYCVALRRIGPNAEFNSGTGS
jgi:hypothetical protein